MNTTPLACGLALGRRRFALFPFNSTYSHSVKDKLHTRKSLFFSEISTFWEHKLNWVTLDGTWLSWDDSYVKEDIANILVGTSEMFAFHLSSVKRAVEAIFIMIKVLWTLWLLADETKSGISGNRPLSIDRR